MAQPPNGQARQAGDANGDAQQRPRKRLGGALVVIGAEPGLWRARGAGLRVRSRPP